MSQAAMRIELPLIVTYNSRGFLTSMLQSVQTQNCMSSSIGTADYAENSAFLMKFISVDGVDLIWMGCQANCLQISVLCGVMSQFFVRF